MKKRTVIIAILTMGIIFCFNPIFAQHKSKGERIGTTTEINNKNIDWEKFDEESTISRDKIEIENLQGLWKAYKGIYKFNELINGMELEEAMIIEFKGKTYRRNATSTFKKFKLAGNLIIPKVEESNDLGVINKITPQLLIISWKDGQNYTRYYYTK